MRRNVGLGALGLVVVLLAGWYGLFWRPAHAAMAAAQARSTKAEATHLRLAQQAASLDAVKRRLPAERRALGALQAALPPTVDVPGLIDGIGATAASSGVSWTNESQTLTTATSASSAAIGASAGSAGTAALSSAGISTVTVSIDVAGGYGQVQSFLGALQQSPRLYVVDSITFTPGKGTDLSAAIQLRAFFDPSPLPAGRNVVVP